mgnify:CR=1 FL=1
MSETNRGYVEGGFNDLFGDYTTAPPPAASAGTTGQTTKSAVSGATEPDKIYDPQIIGGGVYAQYRLGVIKDVYRNQPSLWKAINANREREINIQDTNSRIALLAFLDTRDPNMLNSYLKQEERLAIERTKQVSEQWAEETMKNPQASEEAKMIANGIVARILKPYNLETDLAQFVQFQAGSADAKQSTAQAFSMMNAQGEASKAQAEIYARIKEKEMDFVNNLTIEYFKNAKPTKEKTDFLKSLSPSFKQALEQAEEGGKKMDDLSKQSLANAQVK